MTKKREEKNQKLNYLILKEIYQNEIDSEENLIKLIKTLSLTESLFFCSRIIAVLCKTEYFDFQENCFKQSSETEKQLLIQGFLKPNIEEKDFLNFKKQRLPDIINGKTVVFFPGQILVLIYYLILHGTDNDGKSFNSNQLRTSFYKALLISSDVFTKKFSNDLSASSNEEFAQLSAEEIVLNTLRFCRLQKMLAYDKGDVQPYMAIERGSYLFTDLLNKLDSLPYKNFEEVFKTKTSLSISEYENIVALLVYGIFIFNKPRVDLLKHKTVFNEKSLLKKMPEYNENYQIYLKSETQTVEELKRNSKSFYDFLKSLRSKPILRSNDGDLCVPAPLFLIERASVGPLFVVANHEIFTTFGAVFEEYVREILNRKIKKSILLSNILHSPYKTKDISNNDVEIDAVLDNISELYLIECKAVWLKDKEIYKSNKDYVKALRKKYCDGGIFQLAKKIDDFIAHKWGTKDFPHARVIYPILIIYNRFDDALNHAYFFNKEFFSLLNNSSKEYNVKSLILMTIDILELIENNDSLIEILKSYDKEYPQREKSFHDFVAINELGRENKFLKVEARKD